MFAKFSRRDASGYVRSETVYVEDLATGDIKQLTTDGGGDIINGRRLGDEEEFSIRDGFR